MKKAPAKKMAKGGTVKCATGGPIKLSKGRSGDGGEMGGEKGYAKGGKVARGTGCATKGKSFKGEL